MLAELVWTRSIYLPERTKEASNPSDMALVSQANMANQEENEDRGRKRGLFLFLVFNRVDQQHISPLVREDWLHLKYLQSQMMLVLRKTASQLSRSSLMSYFPRGKQKQTKSIFFTTKLKADGRREMSTKFFLSTFSAKTCLSPCCVWICARLTNPVYLTSDNILAGSEFHWFLKQSPKVKTANSSVGVRFSDPKN